MSRSRRGSWVKSTPWLLLFAVACSPGSKDQEELVLGQSALVTPFQIVTPTGDPKATILSASDSLTIDDRVTVGTASALELVGAFGTTQTMFQAGVQAHANVTSRGPVFLSASDVVQGFLRSGSTVTNPQQPAAQVQGGITQNAPITPVPTSWNVGFPDTNRGDVALEPNLTRTLDPGSWGNLTIKSGSTVFLRTGTYDFLSVSTEPGARILLDKTLGPIFIYVKNAFSLKGPLVSNGGAEGDELVGYLGTSTAYIESPLLGTIVAPNATIELRRPSNNAPHRGAAFGRGVHVFSDATVLRVPFSWAFLCPQGDSDGDGVVDCVDGCPNDPSKTAPLICGCGIAETDLPDKDGVPTCIDQCPADPNNSVRGQCGCAGAGAKIAGTPCTDSPCPNTTGLTCNGAGVCGNPSQCAPAAGCVLRRFEQSYYWFCPGPVSWTQAAQNCRAVPGRSLARISSQLENDFVANVMGGTSWSGANDQSVAGAWRWSNSAGNNGDPFWSGGPAGNRVSGRFTKWAAGEPNTAGTCASVARNGSWAAQSCAATMAYVCEQTVGLVPPPVPPLDPRTSCPDCAGTSGQPQTANCVPSPRTAFGADFETTKKEIEDCINAQADGSCVLSNPTSDACTAACRGASALPPAGSTCNAFQPEEQAYCTLKNTIQTGCTADKDCCGFDNSLIFVSAGFDTFSQPIPQGFDTSSGGLAYVDDGFRGTGPAAPGFESGVRVTSGGNPGAALQVTLGGIDNSAVSNLSGAWQISFTVPQKVLGIVSFDYNLTQTPNYESNELSQVLASVDGALHGTPSGNFIDQVAGDGDGGPSITTGWRSISLNLGSLAAGTHLLRLGGLNTQKNASNESTQILFDNVVFKVRADVCPDGYVCGPAYAAECDPCSTVDANGNCTTNCGRRVLRCGVPELHPAQTAPAETAACANSSLFPDPLCQEIEICAPPNVTGSSDPTATGGLAPTTFDPTTISSNTTTPGAYNVDPPCQGPPGTHCPVTPAHRWCRYNVDLWNDPVLAQADKPKNPTEQKDTLPSGKQGSSGQGSPVSFTFTPDVTLHYSGTPLPFGESNFAVDADASFGARVDFALGPARGGTPIIDAQVMLHADRCLMKDSDSKIMIFGTDFFPSSAKFEQEIDGCEAAVKAYQTAVDRAKKAYRDAIDLVAQYNDRKSKQQKLQDDLCAKIVGDAPASFPPCIPGETAAVTINRFIQFYRDEVKRIAPAFSALASKSLSNQVVPLVQSAQRATQVILQVTFPIGPIPCLLEAEAYVEYGLDGNLVFTISPVGSTGAAETQTIAKVDAQAGPYVLAGASMFVGVGFGVNGFSVSAGVEGAITLGRLSLDAHAGAGIGVQAVPDTRPLPDDIAKLAATGIADTKETLFPINGAKQYNMSLNYDYGLGVTLAQILQGTISGRVRIKVAFFSKTWRQVLLTFPGFGPVNIPLLSGGGAITAVNDDPLGWGNVQMPLPFVNLADLDPREVLTGTAVDYDTNAVGELFYDGMCACTKDGDGCHRDPDCCNKPSSVCFSDPLTGGAKVCSACRPANAGAASTCNKDSDCCSPDSRCLDIPDALPAGVKVCTCVPARGRCDTTGNCCTTPNGSGGINFISCEDDPQDALAATRICRTCRHLGEACVPGFNDSPCCDETPPGGGSGEAICDLSSHLCTFSPLK